MKKLIKPIQMVDLKGQYNKIKAEVDAAIFEVIDSTSFIQGEKVNEFANNLRDYVGSEYCITCANGTDALQIALMALDLQIGDEVIVPAFTYVASAEVIGLLKLTPVLVDVDYNTFNITAASIESAITEKTKAIIPVHLFGQSCNMDEIMNIANKYNLVVIEDNAQALGAIYTNSSRVSKYTGTIGQIGCTSFFPSKNLGCFGDGGALFTNDSMLAKMLKMISSHGQEKKYYHKVIGCNSRLDTIQAALLTVKLKYFNGYSAYRLQVAKRYNEGLKNVRGIILPAHVSWSTHVFNQYTIKVLDGRRDELKKYLEQNSIPTMIYYPLPLQEQEAFSSIVRIGEPLNNTIRLCNEVLSLPIDTEISLETQAYIIETIINFYREKESV